MGSCKNKDLCPITLTRINLFENKLMCYLKEIWQDDVLQFIFSGLTKRGRRLKRLCCKFNIVLSRLSRETLKKWGALRPKSRQAKPRLKISPAQVKQTVSTDNTQQPSIKTNTKTSQLFQLLSSGKQRNMSRHRSKNIHRKKPESCLDNISVSVEDLNTLLVTKADEKMCVRGSNIFVRSSGHLQNTPMKVNAEKSSANVRKSWTPKSPKTLSPNSSPRSNKYLLKYSAKMPQLTNGHSSQVSPPIRRKLHHEVIEISSDDDDIVELCSFTSSDDTAYQSVSSNSIDSAHLQNSSLEKSPDYVNIENCDSDDEITVSKRLQESLQIYAHCSVKLSDVTCCSSSPKTDQEQASIDRNQQPITHLFKCHACKDVEQLYHRQASVHIQKHMSIVHDIGLSGMFDHLIEHQQDFGTYYVIVVEAFPDLSFSPSKYSKSYSGIDFKKYISEKYL